MFIALRVVERHDVGGHIHLADLDDDHLAGGLLDRRHAELLVCDRFNANWGLISAWEIPACAEN
jgi:hypothetical protein